MNEPTSSYQMRAKCDGCGEWTDVTATWNEPHSQYRKLCGKCTNNRVVSFTHPDRTMFRHQFALFLIEFLMEVKDKPAIAVGVDDIETVVERHINKFLDIADGKSGF
jgi:ribosomal protein S27E